jgi:hypothetical protein
MILNALSGAPSRTLVKHCRRYKGAVYNKRVVEYVLTFLREQLVISEGGDAGRDRRPPIQFVN